MRAPAKDQSSTGVGAHEDLAVEALGFLAADETRLERFLAVTGLGPGNLRRAAAGPGFLRSVLDYVAADEALLLAFAANAGRKPEQVGQAIRALAGPPPAADP